MQCLQKEMATCRHWSVSLWRDPDDVPHCRILSSDKTEWQLIPAALCRWRRCFLADQLWSVTRIWEEEEDWAIGCIISMLWQNMWRWYGHVLRKDEGDWVRCMGYEIEGVPEIDLKRLGRNLLTMTWGICICASDALHHKSKANW